VVALNRVAFIGNSLPRRCGIATFTTDLQHAVAASRADLEAVIVAMTDHGQTYDYPSSVGFQINDDRPEDYIRAAEFLNGGQFEVVSLQHEFGIFGGEAGSHILALLSRLTMPVVTTLHTVLFEPRKVQRDVIVRIAEASAKVVVMAEKGRELLRTVYQVADEKIEIIPHGIPEFAFVEPDQAKAKLGFGNRAVILYDAAYEAYITDPNVPHSIFEIPGARDVALGAGALLALRHDAPVRGWVEAGGLADATDVVSVVLAFPRLPRTLRWMVLAVVLTAAAAASLLAPGVDEPEKGARGA